MIELEIDGQRIEVEAGSTIIEAADALGIYIPRYCYHKKLSVAANCRMCLVEVEKVGKPLPACATPVMQDMKVTTRSAKALAAQRDVLEFLLVNHPLDCPICDQGGVCELQDYAMGYGKGHSNFNEAKLAATYSDIGPLISTWMTRCIKCTRCVRFGDEIAGMRELGLVNRGASTEVSTYLPHFVDSELSANITDICPVGALTVKPSQYQDRNWELHEHPSIAPHDCIGSNIYLHTQGHAHFPQRKLVNVVPRENDDVNESWISDRDRFAFYGLQHKDRVTVPLMNHQKKWIETSWQRVLAEVADKLLAIVQHQGPDQIAFIASPSSTTEELYLFQKLARELGCHNIDHRLRQQDFHESESFPACSNGLSLSAIEEQDCIVIIGSHVRHEQPMFSHRLRKAFLNDALLYSINPRDFEYNFELSGKDITSDLLLSIAKLAKALGVNHSSLVDVEVDTFHTDLARQIAGSESPTFVLGAYALEHVQSTAIRALVAEIEAQTEIKMVWLTQGANTAGAWLAGAVPHRNAGGKVIENPGLCATELLSEKPVRAYVLLNVEPEADVVNPSAAIRALEQAGLVVSLSQLASPTMKSVADYILPIAAHHENAGSFINLMSNEQSFVAASVPTAESKPAWKVLRALATFLELDGFHFQHVAQVRSELQEIERAPVTERADFVFTLRSAEGLQRYAPVPIYRSDALVRRSAPLAASNLSVKSSVTIHPDTALQCSLVGQDKVKVKQGDMSCVVPLIIDNRVAPGIVDLAAGPTEGEGVVFGSGHGNIQLEAVL